MEKKTFQVADAAEVKVGRCLAVKKVYQSKTALYFTNKEGISLRLSNHGKFGWRLQVNGKDYDSFCDKGAAQLLAAYMNETLEDAALPIDVSEADGALIVTAVDGTRAALALKKTFSLAFISADGRTVSEVTGVVADGNKLIMKGALAAGEAIYGGGERFDVINKRGTAMALESCDGWNNSGTTYVVQPLFLTTRGGGMFFNRYESANADFGKENENEWFYLIRSKILDVYFYPTSLADALQSCTDFTGHALMPTPWMQGMQICRYGPDYYCFDKTRKFTDLTTVPEYNDLYTVVGKDNYVKLSDLSDEEKAAANRFYVPDANGNFHWLNSLLYVKADNGLYSPKGRKGNPSGDGCKIIMENFISRDMKPDAASMEARGWANCFCDTDESRENKADLQKSYDWLHENGMRAMVYIRVGGVKHECIGFKDEYLVHADVEIKEEDGSVTVRENTTQIPWILGTGDNPDVGRRSGVLRTADYLDITNPDAVNWYFDQLWGEMLEMGCDGVKIDFCECMPDGDRNYGITKTHYKWHNPDLLPAGTEHHAYAAFFISAFTKRMTELKEALGKKDGFMVFSRGGGIGSQRSPYLWAGDQQRDFAKLDDQLMAVVNCGLSAIPYMSYDMAGYAYSGNNYFTIGLEKESEIFARATEFTALTTNMQTHGDVRHVYEMTDEVQDIYKNFTRLHTELIPYMQKVSKIACDTGMPPVRHLVLKYPSDEKVYSMIDEFLLGDALLVAPIITEQTFEREVYLPAGNWTNLLTGEKVAGGQTVTVKANLGQMPIFLDNDSADCAEVAPIFEGANWTAIKNWN
ncbi:MAG: glycoside hydrolase family 31 protein [Clostridia bacterium]|nr:glycoside hydrolase family 31 protein [Clostridia bacterium]